MSDTHYTTYTITVSLDMSMDPPKLTFLDNPRIPLHTLATIVWTIAPNSDPFDFTNLTWCQQPPPKLVSEPIKHGPVMVAVVSNRSTSDIGSFPYQVHIKPAGRNKEIIWPEKCPTDTPKPGDGAKALMAVSGPVIINTGV
jgi:hypothetical protein